MASTLHFRPQPPLFPGLLRPPIKSSFLNTLRLFRNPNPNPGSSSPRFPMISAVSSPDSSWEREEQRWLREEQRWLREERRWIREESRWNAERESLLREIAALRLRPERQIPTEIAGGIATTSYDIEPRPMLAEEADVKEMILEEEVRVSEATVVEEKKVRKERRALRTGSEGEDVQELQEALLKLGFYSGEEDMEYSSFSIGTERAVKTWQASLGTPEDGVMTTELLERLFSGNGESRTMFEVSTGLKGDSVQVALKDGINGVAVASETSISDIRQTFAEENADEKFDETHHRVFLLGENRWEEPSRLIGRNNHTGGNKAASATKCLSCHGVGRLSCTECDGTGEPNIEPQFLEWIGEGAKCAYCEGLGHTPCDNCEGRGTIKA